MAHDEVVDPPAAAAARWCSRKTAIGAALMCVAVVGAQFLSRDVADLGAWAMLAVGNGVPISAVLGLILLTAPPRDRRRSALALIVAIDAIICLLTLYLSHYARGMLDQVAQVTIFLSALLAGIGAYLHFAGVLRSARRPIAAIAFVMLASLLAINAALFVARFGFERGVIGNAWSYTVPGVGERVAPFAFVQDFLIRPQIEMQKNRAEPLHGAYTLVTVATPAWCVLLMAWLMMQNRRRATLASKDST